jgi:hypothetical protein
MVTFDPLVQSNTDVASSANIDPAKINLATGTYSIDAAKLTGTVNVARLAGITTSQLATLAGITSGQIASVASSTLTGTIPAAWLGTTSTTAAVGNAAPNLHAATHEVGGTDPLSLDMGHYNANSIESIAFGREFGVHDQPTINAGTLYVCYFTAPRALTVNQLIMTLSNVFSGCTYLEAALYTVAGDSALTMVRRTGNLSATALTALTAAPNTTTSVTGFTSAGIYSFALNQDSAGSAASNYAMTRGTRYAIGLAANASTTVGKFLGFTGGTSAALVWYNTASFGGIASLLSPVMAKQFANSYTSGSPIPTSHTGTTGAGTPVRLYGVLAG